MAGSPLRNKRVQAKATARKLATKKPTASKGKHGGPRPNSGRPKGKLNEKTLSLHEAYERAFFNQMTEEQRAQLSPLDIFELMSRAALEAKAWDEVKVSAERWAPYVIQKLAPKSIPPPPSLIPDGDQHVVIEQIEIIGGAPKRRPFEEALGRGEEPEDE
jgi:hypothetical protein